MRQVPRGAVKPKLIPENLSPMRSPLLLQMSPSSPKLLVSLTAEVLRKRKNKTKRETLPEKSHQCKSVRQSVWSSAPTSTRKETKQTTNKPNMHTTYSKRLPKIVLRLSQDGSHLESGLGLRIHNQKSRHSKCNLNQPGQGGSTTHSSRNEKKLKTNALDRRGTLL